MLEPRACYRDVLNHHRRWYDTYGKYDHMERWERLLESQPEAAICEALVREELERCVDLVYPNEDLSFGGPDFKCYRKGTNGQRHFYVDSTCLTMASVTKATGLSHLPADGAVHYRLLTDRFKEECRTKARQFSDLDAPGLLAIGTLHLTASQLCFHPHAAAFILTSETLITQWLDSATGDPVGPLHLTTKMDRSSFQRLKKDEPTVIEDARRSISGLLLCPFGGGGPFSLHGVLHPNAVRPFDVSLLPAVPFSVLETDGGGRLHVTYKWHDTE